MEKLKATHGVTTQWHGFELRPPGSPPVPEWYKERIRQAQPEFERIARENFGVTINRGPSGISSRPALIGAKYAEAQGVGEAYNVAVLTAYWQNGRDIGNRAVLAEIAEAMGLEREAYLAALDDEVWLAALLADVHMAHDYAITGVPAMIANDKYFISGAQPYEWLTAAIEKIKALERGE